MTNLLLGKDFEAWLTCEILKTENYVRYICYFWCVCFN